MRISIFFLESILYSFGANSVDGWFDITLIGNVHLTSSCRYKRWGECSRSDVFSSLYFRFVSSLYKFFSFYSENLDRRQLKHDMCSTLMKI